MKITTIKTGYLSENCYLLEKNNQIIIIDPGDDYEKINQHLQNKTIVKILITHHHKDHIGALNHFDKNLILENPEEKTYTEGPFTFTVIETKGHTKDSLTYYFEKEKCMFTGDFLFKGTIGRTDLESGNINDMQKSIKKIKQYPNDTKIYPGHGPSTNLKIEKETNYFLK